MVKPMRNLEEDCRLIRDARGFKDIAATFYMLFYVRESDVALYDELVMRIDEFPENPSIFDWYELSLLWGHADNSTKDELNLSPEMRKAIDDSQKISGTDVKDALVTIGKKFLEEHLSDAHTISARINRLTLEKKHVDDTAFELLKKRNAWVQSEIDNGLRENAEYTRLMQEKNNLLKENISHTDMRVKRLDMALGEILCDVHSRVRSESKILFSQMYTSYEKSKQLQDKIEAIRKNAYESVTTALKDASGISEEEATAWVERNVFIEDNVRRKLRRIGYPPDELKKDMAELYRYLGGKMGPVHFLLEGRSRRAFARGKSIIAVQGSSFNKRTLFHECGHLAEAWDPVFQASCQAFIQGRATGMPVSLKRLTGANYRADEMAYPDTFINPYVGKDYGGRASEVFSMALQHLESYDSLLPLIADPEHFSLLMGFCLRKNPRIIRQVQEYLKQNLYTE